MRIKKRFVGRCFKYLEAVVLILGLVACSLRFGPQTPMETTVATTTLPPLEDLVSATEPALDASPIVELSTPEPVVAATETPSDTEVPTPDVAAVTPDVQTPVGEEDSPTTQMVGVEVHLVDTQGGLDLVEQAGVRWVRHNGLLWSEVEQVEGERNWDALAQLETELINAADRDLQVILIVRSTPAWAQMAQGYLCGPVVPEKLGAFASFMHDVVARYSIPPYNVKYWELGNEPDIDRAYVPPNSAFGCWGDQMDPYYGGSYYAEMLKSVYPQVKIADPDAQVVIGGLLLDCDPINPPETSPGSGQPKDCTPSRYLEGILANGGGDYFDGISFHAYDYGGGLMYINPNWHSSWDVTGPVLVEKTRYLRSLLNEYGFPEKYLINSEVALICGRDGSEPPCQADEFHLMKAYYAAQANASALAEGLLANIWYSITGWRGSGLVDEQFQPYPVYDALRFSATQLQNAIFVGEANQFTGVRGYEFSRDGTRLWILWSLDGLDHGVLLPSQPIAIFDVFGAPLDLSQDLTVNVAPVYIEWAP